MRSLFALVIALHFPLCAAMREDTARLASHLKALRGLKDLSAAQYEKIQAEYLDWLDRRVTAGTRVPSINQELKAAQLLRLPSAGNDFDDSQAGYLDEIHKVSVRGADDLFVIAAPIPAGDYCSDDVTAIIYQTRPVKRAGWINAQRLDGHGSELTGIAAGEEKNGTRVIATGWNLTNCTSAWTPKKVRIDRLGGGSGTNILHRDLWAYSSRDESVAPWISDDVVTFLYDSGSFIVDVFTVPAIARYRLSDGHADRADPIALTVAGFIHEWLNLNEEEAKRWSAPEALRIHHELAIEAQHDAAKLDGVGRCSETPPVWEVAVRWSPEKARVYRVEGDRATALRMPEVRETVSRLCNSLGEGGLEAIRRELPW